MTTKLEKSVTEIAKDRETVINRLIDFSRTDMLLFWSGNQELSEIQQKLWMPVLLWAKEKFDTKFKTTQTLDVPEQENEVETKLKNFMQALSDKELTGFYYAALNMRSVLLAAALIKGQITADQAFEASCIEELWQAKHWGKEETADCRRQGLLKELQEIEAFVK